MSTVDSVLWRGSRPTQPTRARVSSSRRDRLNVPGRPMPATAATAPPTIGKNEISPRSPRSAPRFVSSVSSSFRFSLVPDTARSIASSARCGGTPM